ncbi:FAD-binding domain-containing protein [Desulfosediminicola ganghwensis]|uniref:FAD-binding domain-containing protein n=1 Tax=Desulfosediminicola ganghwensis TaxID=2569540 RepID=UPI0010ABF135|nr:FAD-binding domain-containing protein [Desulfosediminicola ganghwensis]
MLRLLIIWHLKYFDFHIPRLHLIKHYNMPVAPRGLITAESKCSAAEHGKSFLGIPRVSAHRLNFYDACVEELGKQYAAANLPLEITEKKAAEIFIELAERYDEVEVWVPDQPGTEEVDFLLELKNVLPAKVVFHQLPSNTLLQADELPMEVGKIPRTFSGFRKRVEKKGYHQYGFSRMQEVSDFLPTRFSPARQRVKQYIFEDQHIINYKYTRNGLGPGDYSSRFGKWLAAGTVSAAEIGAAILKYEKERKKNISTYWLLFELLWRDYFHFLHKKIGAQLFTPQGMKQRRSPGLVDSIAWRFTGSNVAMQIPAAHRKEAEELWGAFRSWALASNGMEFIDAMMLELYATGELSNRGRQCAASYLIHDLHVPWWWGAQWFEYLLTDYDVSSNWGNWAYIAGVGADSRPVHRFNITNQARKYDADHFYRDWVKEQKWSVPEDALPEEFPGEFV